MYWHALAAVGLRRDDWLVLNHQAVFVDVGLGSAYFRLADGLRLKMPNRGLVDYGAASDELLSVLASWGIRPTASGKYPVPEDASYQLAIDPPVWFSPPPEDQ